MSTDKSTFEPATSWLNETIITLKMFNKISLQLIFEFAPVIIGNMFIGHITNSGVLMAACGIARSFTETSASGFAWGLTTALKTLIPQCIGMSHNKNYLISIYVQRALIITSIALIPLSILQLFAADIIQFIYGKTYCNKNHFCEIISIYCKCIIPYVWFRIWIAICQRIGQNLDLNIEITIALFISFLSCFPLNYFFIFYMNLTFMGAAFASNIVNLIACISVLLAIYLRNHGYIFIPKRFHKVCDYNGIKEYMLLTLPGTGRAVTDFFISEIYILMSAFIHNATIAVSASTILYGINIISINFAESLGLVLSVRIGKYVGAASILHSKRSIYIGFILSLILMILTSLIIYIALIVYGEYLIRFLWINNYEIVDIVQQLMYVILIRNIIMIWFFCLVGIFAGIGYPQYAGYGLLICFWFIGIPIQLILLFVYDLKQYTQIALFIIWSTPAFTRAICCLFMTIVLFWRIDWNTIIEKSQTRILIDTISPNYGSIHRAFK
eukprot:69251_1